jgi:peptidoglycan hydrolase-like protein with peptidoglycan-binding domain
MSTIGFDIASVDGNGTPDWAAASSTGRLRFAGLRAAEGLTPDSWYPTYRRQLDARGIPNFPYLRLVPNLSTPEAQVRAVLDVIGIFNDHYFPIALDVEGDRQGLTAEQWLDWVIRACREVRAALDVPPLLYTSRSYWIDPDGLDGLQAPELADCSGWWKFWPYPVGSQAVYAPSVVEHLPRPPAPPPFGSQWILQQYMGDALNYLGFRSTVDMDRLHVQQEGNSDDSVKWIQRRLPSIAVDGVFGPKTTAAVKMFQTRSKIASDGIVGLDTTQLLAWVTPKAS